MCVDQGLVNAQKCLVPIGPYPGGSSPKPGSCRYQTRKIRISVIKMCLNTNQDLSYQNVSYYKSGSQLSKCVSTWKLSKHKIKTKSYIIFILLPVYNIHEQAVNISAAQLTTYTYVNILLHNVHVHNCFTLMYHIPCCR